MALDEPKDTDDTNDIDGVTYLVDKDLSSRVGKINVDYVERGWRSGFVIASEKPVGFGLPTCGSGCSC